MTVGIMHGLLLGIAASLLMSCSDMSVSGQLQRSGNPKIEKLDKLSAGPSEVVTILGSNLPDILDIKVNDVPVVFTAISKQEGQFSMPGALDETLLPVTFSFKGKHIAKIPLLNASVVNTLEPLSVGPEFICDTEIFKKSNGELARGQGRCRKECTQDGQADCVTPKSRPSFNTVTLSQKISEGRTVAGVVGKNPNPPAQCAAQ